MVMVVTVVVSLLAGLAFRRKFRRRDARCSTWRSPASSCPRSSSRSASASSSSRSASARPGTRSAFGAHLTWTLPFGVLIMFAVFNRFSPAYEEAARDLGATLVADVLPRRAADDRAEPDRRRPVRLHALL